ncbi:MAG TPA: nuclear transport factor 2 family protein [Aquabacterium sp.]|uniref:nuclear transport factor 2 family protein n=1 Tax=Aquabacterium sp. TaxID=1872578 RepID=UPI002E2F976A|nr:nuclear transport factor 2 family protein [Aquabacterium sp.]HEX5355311.1 nuclear transport factor 2 family protein [Aquabacterium sp.]
MSTEVNKATAVQFLQLAASARIDEAYELVAPHFRHHNPYFEGNASALKTGMRDNAKNCPDKTFEVQRVIAEGELVAVHSRVQMPSKAMTAAVIHILRFELGKIVELWDVGQPQPADMVNETGMF